VAAPAKDKVVFDEKFRVALMPDLNLYPKLESFFHVDYWEMTPHSKNLIKFLQANDDDDGIDDGCTCYIQALREVGTATIIAHYRYKEEPTVYDRECEVSILSDQVQYTTNVIEAPYVGYSLSTPQLYVTTNIGYQVFRNTFDDPEHLRATQVCAVIQNSFAAGMYLNGAGDFPIVMNQFDLSNLEYQLVDSNYHPIKLLSPMFVIMRVDPMIDPAQDITIFRGRLPKNQPTPQQRVQILVAAQERAQQESARQLVIDALAKVAMALLPQNPP
jgi:hypothetical protein